MTARLGKRARAALVLLAAGRFQRQVAEALGVSAPTVSLWAARFVREGRLIRSGRWPALYSMGPNYPREDLSKGGQASLDAFRISGAELAPRPRRGPGEGVPIRLHRLQFKFPVIRGPDPTALHREDFWEANGVPFFKWSIGLEEGRPEDVSVVLAWGPRKRSFEVTFPSLWLEVRPGERLEDRISYWTRIFIARAQEWITGHLGYQIGQGVACVPAHMASTEIAKRLLVPGVGYVALSASGDAWIDESLGQPEIETTNPVLMQAWVDYEADPASLLREITQLRKRVESLEAAFAQSQGK